MGVDAVTGNERTFGVSVATDRTVSEDPGRLLTIESGHREIDAAAAIESLRQDSVVLVRRISAEQADSLMYEVAAAFDLADSLELQAGFASVHGHRHNIGKYFMSVNKRDDYQFIPPHSEGDSSSGMQLASFFCFENDTDGGETILMNVDDSSEAWQSLREKRTKARAGYRPLTSGEIARVRAQYRLNLPDDTLHEEDTILQERESDVPGLTLVDVLAKPRKVRSRILARDVYTYWDSIASVDYDSLALFTRSLKQADLLREPPGGREIREMDNAWFRRVWRSEVDHGLLFNCKITIKLSPGDLVIQNNLTWTHAASNWHPGSGTRTVAAAFA